MSETKEVKTRGVKTGAVKEALAALGNDASPTDICAWVKEKKGVELSPNHASNIKSSMTKKGGKKPRPKAETEANGNGHTLDDPCAGEWKDAYTASEGSDWPAFSLEDVQTIKHLLTRYPAAAMHRLVDLLD